MRGKENEVDTVTTLFAYLKYIKEKINLVILIWFQVFHQKIHQTIERLKLVGPTTSFIHLIFISLFSFLPNKLF